MYAIAILRYRRPVEQLLPTVEAHRAYLRGLKDQGLVLASGPLDPRFGGAVLFRVPDEGALATLDRLRDGDPFIQAGLVQYEILPWALTLGAAELDAAFPPPPPATE
jgi:uncharacterized protein YciI